MDDLDKEIIYILQQDSKITNAQLAKEIGLSPSSSLERVRRLESNGIIKGYSLILDKEKIGIECGFLVYIKLISIHKDTVENFIDIIKDIPQITEAHKISGIADFVLKVYCSRVADFEYLISEVLGEIEEIKEVRSEIILDTIKEKEPLPINSEVTEYI
ncbi:MAG: Lrp/AsnC family transcriptional regulator [Bacteroidetes bacterium]|nr:Lrp/AsnC family transcriptional regulator [Bacteroidota bacterium]